MKYLSETGLRRLIKNIQTELRQMKNEASTAENPFTWSEIHDLLQNGEGPLHFTVGDQLICNHKELGPIVWDIIALDHDEANTITLQTHDLLPRYMFDQREAFYVAEQELSAGEYCVKTPDGYREEYGGGSYMTFTLTNSAPAGSFLVHVWDPGANIPDSKVRVYHQPSDSEAAETCPVTYGQQGTELTALRHLSCGSGSSRWGESALRKYLNDDLWTPSSSADRPPMEMPPSFCAGFDADFLSVLMPMTKKEINLTNGGEDTFTDRFTIPSFGEVNGGNGPHADDLEAYDYYAEQAAGTEDQAERIKLLNGKPSPYFLRSPYADGGMGAVYFVTETGRINHAPACQKFGIAPICCIS